MRIGPRPGRPSLTCAARSDMLLNMKTISLSVSTEDYEAFRRGARRSKRPIAQLIREAMAFYRQECLEEKSRLDEVPVLVGPRPVSGLPGRAEIYEEIFGGDAGEPTQ